jgi:hypothetical protein
MFNTTKNTVSGTVKTPGKTVETSETFDAYADLCKDGAAASVSCTYGMAKNFGEEKVSFHVTVRCDQTEECINEAGKRAFLKAVEFVGDAADNLGWTKGTP